MESEFWGHVAGAFSEAREAEAGLIVHVKCGILSLTGGVHGYQ